MRYSTFFHNCRAAPALLTALAVSGALALSGCGTTTYAPGPDFSPEAHDYLRADDTAAYGACTAMCAEDTALALVTRTGCLEGCREVLERFTLHDKAFTGRKECLDALLQEDLSREHRVAAMKRWCDAQWSHVHNRKGCYMAAEKFYASLAPGNVCGTDAADNALYDEELRRAREEAAKTPPQPDQTLSEPRPVPAEDPAPVAHSTQPPGPLDPPTYRAAEDTLPAQPSEAAPIRDTPKYQKTVPGKTRSADKPKDAPKDSAPPLADPAPVPEPALPQAPSAPAKASDIPPAPPEPAAPANTATPDTGMMEKPALETAPLPEAAPSAVPLARQPETQPEPARPGNAVSPERSLPPKSEGPPVPGLNANRPLPPEQPGDPAQPGTPVLMPPVPSMLDKPYETPTIISPQIEVDGK